MLGSSSLPGAVSILINNAARAIVGTTVSLTPEQFREVIDTNLVGTFLGTRAVVPSMRSAGGGTIVNINSTAGLGVAAGLSAYGTSKWAIRGLTKIAAKELGLQGIRVNGVHPGIIDTPLAYDPATDELIVSVDEQPIPRLAHVDEITTLALYAASDEAAYSTGTEFVADGATYSDRPRPSGCGRRRGRTPPAAPRPPRWRSRQTGRTSAPASRRR